MDRRSAMIGASGLLAALMFGGPHALGQAARPTAAPRQAAPAPAAAQQRQAAPADPGIDVETLLKKWEGQSSKLKTLDVGIFRKDTIPEFDEVEYFEGRAIFRSPNFAFIDFKKIKQDEKKNPLKKNDKWDVADDERIICTGTEVWQYKSDTRQIFIYPLERDQAAKAIEEGPLPFLFNMKAEEAKQRYDIGMVPPEKLNKPDPNSYYVAITPKLDVDRESFSQAFVRLDRSFVLPVQIILYAPNGKGTKNFSLNPVKPNAQVNDANFVPKEKDFTDLGWKVVRNPGGNAAPAARPGGAPAARPAADSPANAARPAAANALPKR